MLPEDPKLRHHCNKPKRARLSLASRSPRKNSRNGKPDKEEIGGYEYNYSHEEIIIEADRGAVHENTIQIILLVVW